MNKNSKLKKLIALALIFVFCVALLPLEIFAAENDSILTKNQRISAGARKTNAVLTPYIMIYKKSPLRKCS